jgi:choline dehydrogenase-like flavoprotein
MTSMARWRAAECEGPDSAQPIWPVFVQAGVQAGFANPDFNGADQEGVGMYQVTHKNGERWSAAKAYLTPHLGGPTCRSSPAHTTRILMEGKRAVGVEYRQDGELKQLRASARCC